MVLCRFVKSPSELKTGESIKWQTTDKFLYPNNSVIWSYKMTQPVTTISCKIQTPWNEGQNNKNWVFL